MPRCIMLTLSFLKPLYRCRFTLRPFNWANNNCTVIAWLMLNTSLGSKTSCCLIGWPFRVIMILGSISSISNCPWDSTIAKYTPLASFRSLAANRRKACAICTPRDWQNNRKLAYFCWRSPSLSTDLWSNNDLADFGSTAAVVLRLAGSTSSTKSGRACCDMMTWLPESELILSHEFNAV